MVQAQVTFTNTNLTVLTTSDFETIDRAVDACCRKAAFASDAQRVEFLFECYQQLTSLLPSVSAKKVRKSKA